MCYSPDPAATRSLDPIDFSQTTLHRMFMHCDDFSPKKGGVLGNNLLMYLAYSRNPGYDHKGCCDAMIDRQGPDNLPYFGWKTFEQSMFLKRFRLLCSNNRAYALARKDNPTTQDLEEFSYLDPCFSNLSPVVQYLIDHPELAREYKGLLPFGREVVKFFNTMTPPEWRIKGSPSFKDHIRLQEISNRKAILMGLPTVTINSMMYQFGRLINPEESGDDEE